MGKDQQNVITRTGGGYMISIYGMCNGKGGVRIQQV
jgi:hypothetical protein